MAYAKTTSKTTHHNHLVSWNIKGEGAAQDRKKTVSTYLNVLRPSADILFLQEVQWAPTNLRSHLSELHDHYELNHYSQEYANCYNCVIFDKRKFGALPSELQTPLVNSFKLMDKWNEWEKRGFRTSQEKQMRNRMCMVVLHDKSDGCKFIAASLHNLNNKDYSIKMAELCLQLLALVGETTGYPVILAGDFNANIQKSSEVTRLGFIIPEYKPTLHRMSRKSPIDVTIDFFLYRPGKHAHAVLHNVKADLARDDVIDSKGIINDKKMDELHKVSNHDPLQATLQLSSKVATKPSAAAAVASKKPPMTAAKVTTKPSAAVVSSSSKRPPSSSSKAVIKSAVTSSTNTSTCVKREQPTTTKSTSVKSTVAAARAPPKPSSIKPSAGQSTVKKSSTAKK